MGYEKTKIINMSPAFMNGKERNGILRAPLQISSDVLSMT